MFCVRREEKGDGWAGSWGDSQKKHHEEELTWTRRLARIIFLFLSRKILISRYFASSSHPSIWPFFFIVTSPIGGKGRIELRPWGLSYLLSPPALPSLLPPQIWSREFRGISRGRRGSVDSRPTTRSASKLEKLVSLCCIRTLYPKETLLWFMSAFMD